ncbi:MAG TPA: hypothetical protein VHU23_12835 [Rhizomicrobium sp.]|jgi:hypothetical protein|nr:hypothetical protein [Rhizomicrobium sp.]
MIFTFWDLLTLLAFSGAAGGSWVAAGSSHANSALKILLVACGIFIGICCVWCIRSFGRRMIAQFDRNEDGSLIQSPQDELMIKAMYGFAIIWIVISGGIGFWITMFLVRL